MSFVHLHVHSEYSLLDGFSNIKKLVTRARDMNMPALALTDHGTMFGVIDFYNEARHAGIKPLIGLETYLAPRGMDSREPGLDKRSIHLLLLAENQQGYQNLLQIASAAQLQGFYYFPRIDHQFLSTHSEGLIWTTGCMASEIPRLLHDGNLEEVRRKLDFYFDVFGPDRYFFELQHHEIPELHTINSHLRELGPRYKARFVATNPDPSGPTEDGPVLGGAHPDLPPFPRDAAVELVEAPRRDAVLPREEPVRGPRAGVAEDLVEVGGRSPRDVEEARRVARLDERIGRSPDIELERISRILDQHPTIA